jgi:glycosyltransferase involved in cell wall biosynthesis
MTTMHCRTPDRTAPGAIRLALAVADVNWFTTENLFRALDREGVASLLLDCSDYVNAWRRGCRPWRRPGGLHALGPRTWRHELVLPPGWMKRYPRIGMRPIRKAVERWRRREAPGAPLALVMTYPHYLHLRDAVRPDLSVYLNLDDYTLYWPSRAAEIAELERRAVRESDLTACVARVRREELAAAVPEAADRIHHIPHGAPDFTIAPTPEHRPGEAPDDLKRLPRPWLGYIGSLEDRLDWPLLSALATSRPDASVVLIGRLPPAAGAPWEDDRRRVLALPNVHHLGWRSQPEIGRYYRSFDVCLIPYRTDHPFNIACCPTKILDSMGGGRPIVATDLPECRLYAHLFPVARTHADFLAAVPAVLADDRHSHTRWEHARQHRCSRVAETLLAALGIE